MKKFIASALCSAVIFCALASPADADNENTLSVSAKSAILTEQSTGEVLYESNADEQLPIASVTKIMTMLIIMEKIDEGALAMDDIVTASERAMSMGGSTMFLEAGEQLTVHDMLKGIAVASANDGCVAMAEHISGSVEAFVDLMNRRASELGMTNTHFVNTNGLDADGHFSSARDVAIMSAELLKHEAIFEFTTIWTDELRDGRFQLANTNKLIRFYPGANGLKTGSTSKAGCCISAAAARDGMQLIAVVLGAPDSTLRFESAKSLLNYGFAGWQIKSLCEKDQEIDRLPVYGGVADTVKAVCAESCGILSKKGEDPDAQLEISAYDIKAPVSEGDIIGHIKYTRDGAVLCEADMYAAESVAKKTFGMTINDMIKKLLNAPLPESDGGAFAYGYIKNPRKA